MHSIEDILLFLDVILTGQEFAEYSADEREAMFREIREIVAKEPERDKLHALRRTIWLAVRSVPGHAVIIPKSEAIDYDEKDSIIEVWEDVASNDYLRIRALKKGEEIIRSHDHSKFLPEEKEGQTHRP